MIQRLGARLGGIDEDGKIFARLLLTDEIGQPLGAQGGFQRVVFGTLGGDDALLCHRAMPFNASRIRAPVSVSSPSACTARATASVARTSL